MLGACARKRAEANMHAFRRSLGLSQSFVLFDPNIFHIFRAPDAQIVQVFRAEMVRLAACLGDSGAVEALIRLGLGREDRVLVFRCDLPRPRRLRSEWSVFRGRRTRSTALN